MNLYNTLVGYFADRARTAAIRRVTIGIGYTSVEIETANGRRGMGLSYTWLPIKTGCHVVREYQPWEGQSATSLLNRIESDNTLDRTLGVACVNALNYEYANCLSEETGNNHLFDALSISSGSTVIMVGLFKPLIEPMKKLCASVEIFDEHHGIGNERRLLESIDAGADAFIVSATSLLNNTMETILSHIPDGAKTVILGPSAPMVPEVFKKFPVTMIAGTVPVDFEAVEQAVRHGTGTPVIQKHGKKVSVML